MGAVCIDESEGERVSSMFILRMRAGNPETPNFNITLGLILTHDTDFHNSTCTHIIANYVDHINNNTMYNHRYNFTKFLIPI